MSLIAPTYEVIHPSMMLPEIILPYSQASGAFFLLPTEEPRVMLGEGDQAVYIRRLDVRTKAQAGQSAFEELPSPDIVATMINTPTYLVQARAEYNHHDTARAGVYGFSLVEATRLANQQGFVNTGRTALLYGMNPANGEGLLNANGATFVTLPADSYGNDTAASYDNGQMAFFLQNIAGQIKVRTNNLGIGNKFVYLGPQRIFELFAYNVVQVVQYQRPGAGTTSTLGVIKEVLLQNGDTVIWVYDDTLIGKGQGGTDAVIVCMPEVKKPMQDNPWNTNRFATLSPGLEATVMMLCDMPAPREITVPLPKGAVDTTFEQRITSGWPIRPEAITIISLQYE
jgi:hypothetical protein